MKTIKDFDLKNKKVIIRVDFNVPMKDSVITDDNRIRESLKTINYAIDNDAKVILLSHLGRIKEESDLENNDIGSVSSLSKIKNNVNNNAGKARNVKKNSNLKMKIAGFIVIFILLCVQIFSYGYYYIRNTLYKHYL